MKCSGSRTPMRLTLIAGLALALLAPAGRSDAQVLYGNALAGLKDFDASIKELQSAIALDPNKDTAFISLGTVQSERGNAAEAEKAFRRAIDVAPRAINPRLALANFFWTNNRQPEAEELHRQHPGKGEDAKDHRRAHA